MNTTPSPAIEAVEQIERALAKATPGTWHWDEDDNMYPSPRDYTKGLYPQAIIETDSGVYGPRDADREYIVAVQPNNIRAVLALLAAKQEEVDKMRADAVEAEKETAALRLYKHNMEARYSMLTATINNHQGAAQ